MLRAWIKVRPTERRPALLEFNRRVVAGVPERPRRNSGSDDEVDGAEELIRAAVPARSIVYGRRGSPPRSPKRGFDFTPVMFAMLALFIAIGSFQFLDALPGAERGLFLSEKACPIYQHSSLDRPLVHGDDDCMDEGARS